MNKDKRETEYVECDRNIKNAPMGSMGSACVDAIRDFGFALKEMHHGRTLARSGWNGRGMWIALQRPDAGSKMSLPYIFMHTAQGQRVPWLASQTDLLSTDWYIA